MKCNACHGRRVITRTVPEMKRSQGVDYATGRDVERLYQCETCGGTGRQPEPDPTPPAGHVVMCGGFIEAPGFSDATFAAGLEKARKAGYFHVTPARPGSVIVETANTDGAGYVVTRNGCSCRGHAGHGHCYHRAGCIAIADLFGVNLCTTEVLGFHDGAPVTAADRVAQLEGAA